MKPRGFFDVASFDNRSCSQSWRVTGTKQNGERVRKNFKTKAEALAEKQRLEIEAANLRPAAGLVRTRLTHDQCAEAERAFSDLNGQSLPLAVRYFLDNYRDTSSSPRLLDALKQFIEWLDPDSAASDCDLAAHTRSGYRLRVSMFANSVPNVTVAEITPALIKSYLSNRGKPAAPNASLVGKTTLRNDRRAICRFLSWCVEKEWIDVNPAIGPRQKQGGKRNATPRHFHGEAMQGAAACRREA